MVAPGNFSVDFDSRFGVEVVFSCADEPRLLLREFALETVSCEVDPRGEGERWRRRRRRRGD